MMSMLMTVGLALALAQTTPAGSGYRYSADLNGDGLADSIVSGPAEMFGNGGGPFLLSLSLGDSEFTRHVVLLHPQAVAWERNGRHSRLWSYHRSGASAGSLSSLSLDGRFERQTIRLQLDPDESGLNRALYALLFAGEHKLEFDPVQAHVPPDWPWGKE